MIETISELKRLAAPAVTPQALAWHKNKLWIGSRDQRRVYRVDPSSWQVEEEIEPPGIPWAAVSVGDAMFFTLGEGADDDRYIRRFVPGEGFSKAATACPDFTGSYLSHDGEHLYLSQWYKHRILQFDETGAIGRTLEIGAEICGHTFVDGVLYVIRGTEQDGEHWRIARLDSRAETPEVRDLARVPFACRSLTFDGTNFWTNHRAANETVQFALPDSAS